MANKKKIAVLGGGVSSMITAYELTSQPDWQDHYEITVYQMGWRLGGKGASGRNPDIAQRIEEHGLHLWFGFYDNAFKAMRRIYEENARPLGKPLSRWNEAFKPYNWVVLEDKREGKWEHWGVDFPMNDGQPGDSTELPTVSEYLVLIIKEMVGMYKYYQNDYALDGADIHQEDETFLEYVKNSAKNIMHSIEVMSLDIIGKLVYSALALVEKWDKDDPKHNKILIEILEKILKKLWGRMEKAINDSRAAHRFMVMMDMMSSMAIGMVRDGVITKGFDVINDMDFREWLKRNGANDITLNSGPVQAVYGLVFGGFKFYSFEAGTALRGCMRLIFTYKGAMYYRMQAGMGDTIFSPIYEVLQRKGVKFKFFHKVKNLKPSADGTYIESIQIGRQATVKGGGEYQPLVDVKGLPCWPSYVLYDQLEEGEQLKKENINLESYWSPWKDVEEITLEHGRDYDIVVQGISIGALPVIAKEILEAREDWRLMVKHVTATQTQAFQLWLKPDDAGMGWPFWNMGLGMVGSYEEPNDTWADMSDLIIREEWPSNEFPHNIAYLCGYMDEPLAPYTDHDFPARIEKKVRDTALIYMQQYAQHLWPNTVGPDGFKWDLLCDVNKGEGIERFDAQFFRGNIDPTELYVLSETNSTKYRLRADQSGYTNMFLTGDWIFNGFNAGCVEASVMSGMQTARSTLRYIFDVPRHDQKPAPKKAVLAEADAVGSESDDFGIVITGEVDRV